MKYTQHNNGQDTLEQYELDLEDDGTFCYSVTYSDPAGAAGGVTARGTWKRSGDQIALTVTKRTDETSQVPTSATMRGNSVEIAGITLTP